MGDETSGGASGAKKKGGTGKGEFFKVDRKGWEAATGLGMNPAVAYLVLARFSDRSNQFTTASVHAVETHTGISRGRAKKAVEELLAKGLLRRVNAEDAVRPRYEFVISEKAEPIWLPNAIVTGAATEVPPVERLRQVSDVLVLRLFVDLYRLQVLPESHGVDRLQLWRSYERRSVGQAAEFELWLFEGPKATHVGDTAEFLTGQQLTGHRHFGRNGPRMVPAPKERWAEFWERLRTLESVGLIEWIPHLYESAAPEAEALHACGRRETESLDDQLGLAAHWAAVALLDKFNPDAVRPWMVPVRKHLVNVQMIGVARLRYMPRTGLTAAWWAQVHKKGEAFLQEYRSIAKRASS